MNAAPVAAPAPFHAAPARPRAGAVVFPSVFDWFDGRFTPTADIDAPARGVRFVRPVLCGAAGGCSGVADLAADRAAQGHFLIPPLKVPASQSIFASSIARHALASFSYLSFYH